MTTVSGKKAVKSTKSTNIADAEREFSKIKEGIKHNQAKIAEFLRQRVGPGDWELTEVDVPLDEEGGTIDMIFSSADGKKEKYILIDVSVPHIGIGQKYLLPTQAKIFQKTREVPATRIKKAIILVRKGTETISVQALKVRCPIIEIQLENIIKQKKAEPKQEQKEKAEVISTEAKQENKKASDHEKANKNREKAQNVSEEPKEKKLGFASLSEDLLYALKEAIVHESLSTTYKRSNKYIRRGLWHWIEREIMDPNVHFFLIILSSIYQSKTGEILSKKFRTVESYIDNPEGVINAIFCRENALADEIKKNSERHKKALTKFLCCFSQMQPFEYLKSLFLKDFRSNGDGLKARMSVFTTLEQLLARCGFEGEKEVNYPLEILDELKIFQGVMCGNYEKLRTDNASKKLKHLVPQIEWEEEDIYALRDQLAKILNLPSNEFNLNAYLPQAFLQDARNMVESKKEALRQNNKENNHHQSVTSENSKKDETSEAPAKLSRQERMALQKQAKLEKAARKQKYDDDFMPKKRHQQDNIDMPMLSENGDFLSEEAIAERNDQKLLLNSEMPNEEIKRILDDPYAFTESTSKRKRVKIEESEEVEENSQEVQEDSEAIEELMPNPEAIPEPIVERALPRERKRSRYADVDESRHRHFENYGGIDEDDPDVIRLSLALAHHNENQDGNDEEENNNERVGVEPIIDEIIEEEEAPTKTMIMQGYHPSINRNDNRKQQGNNFHRHNHNNRQNNRGSNNQNNMNRNRNNGNRSNNDGNNGYREHKKFYQPRNGNNFHRRPRRDNGGNNQ